MSLDWSLGCIEGFEQVCYYTDEEGKTRLHSITETLIYLTMYIGINDLSSNKNLLEFVKRVKIYEGVFGAFRKIGNDPVYIKPEEILVHKGLKTNASPKSRSTFMRSIWTSLDREVKLVPKGEQKDELPTT